MNCALCMSCMTESVGRLTQTVVCKRDRVSAANSGSFALGPIALADAGRAAAAAMADAPARMARRVSVVGWSVAVDMGLLLVGGQGRGGGETPLRPAMPGPAERGQSISFIVFSHLMNRYCASTPAAWNARRMRPLRRAALSMRWRCRRLRSVAVMGLSWSGGRPITRQIATV